MRAGTPRRRAASARMRTTAWWRALMAGPERVAHTSACQPSVSAALRCSHEGAAAP